MELVIGALAFACGFVSGAALVMGVMGAAWFFCAAPTRKKSREDEALRRDTADNGVIVEVYKSSGGKKIHKKRGCSNAGKDSSEIFMVPVDLVDLEWCKVCCKKSGSSAARMKDMQG
jgi:hypothetical protein